MYVNVYTWFHSRKAAILGENQDKPIYFGDKHSTTASDFDMNRVIRTNQRFFLQGFLKGL